MRVVFIPLECAVRIVATRHSADFGSSADAEVACFFGIGKRLIVGKVNRSAGSRKRIVDVYIDRALAVCSYERNGNIRPLAGVTIGVYGKEICTSVNLNSNSILTNTYGKTFRCTGDR